MTWVKLDDQFSDHPKIAALGELAPLAGWLHVCALCYAARYLTDGHIPTGQVARLAAVDSAPLVKALVDVGLWEQSERGYVIHDYLEFNPSREQTLAAREAKRAGGRRGGQATAQARAQAYAIASTQASAGVDGEPMLAPPAVAYSHSPSPSPSPSYDAAATAHAHEATEGQERSSIEDEPHEETLPPYLMDDEDPMDALLLELWEVPGWKRKPADDRAELARLGAAFPRADLATAIQQLRAKALDGAVKAGPRSALQAFVKQLHLQTPEPQVFAAEPPGPDPPVDFVDGAKFARELKERFRPGGRPGARL